MQIFTVQAHGAIPPLRKVALTRAQALAREHLLPAEALAALRAGKSETITFETMSPLNFKPGETIGVDGDLNGRLRAMLGDPQTAGRPSRTPRVADAEAAE